MDASMSMITLGVRDLEAARRFYLAGLGWAPALEVPGDVTFVQVGPMMLVGLWSSAKLSAEAGGLYQGDEAAPISLAHMGPDAPSVGRVLDDAVRAGGQLVCPATEREWGGVTGYFADPDGYRWEVAWNPSTDPVLGPILGPEAAAARLRGAATTGGASGAAVAAEGEGQTSPPAHLSATLEDDPRPALPLHGGERETLTAFLEHHRTTFELKCLGAAPDRWSDTSIPPSGLSLHGLIRHLTGVERWWWRIQFAGEDVPLLYYTDDDPDQDFDDLAGDPEVALERWRQECARSREILAAAASLDAVGTKRTTGETFSLRGLFSHLIAEYARHNGHADLLREQIDGAVGQ